MELIFFNQFSRELGKQHGHGWRLHDSGVLQREDVETDQVGIETDQVGMKPGRRWKSWSIGL